MKQVNDINDYLKIIEQIKINNSLFFRGQLEKYNGFTPTIARNPRYILNENNILNDIFKNRTDDFNELDTPLKKLAKMQHYGFPTRLVDLTINPLVALYFAVEDVEDRSPGNVYIFDEECFSTVSTEAKLLSILPYLAEQDVSKIVLEYNKQYNETISAEEVLLIMQKPIFIKYSNELEESNPRLYHQSGTFLVCTNKFVDGRFTDELVSLQNFQPTEVVRIPFEYKMEIKQRLDKEYSINYINEYPELIPFAVYIKNKYKITPVSKDVLYSVVSVKDVSTFAAKRMSITAILQQQVDIEKIKKLAIEIINNYKNSMDVVWVYIARNTDDLISFNWILRCQWINPHLNKNAWPMTFKHFECECYWEFSKSYSIDSDIMQSTFKEDDNTLLLSHELIWNDFLKVYKLLKNTLIELGWDKFVEEADLMKQDITKLYKELQDFGHSHNKEFDDFLYEFSNCIAEVDNLRYVLGDDSIPIKGKQHFVEKAFNKSDKKISKICEGISYWERSLQMQD